MNHQPYQPNQSIMDGIVILQILAGSRGPVSCADISRQLGLEVTRVNRILKTLTYMGMAYRTDRRKYMAGPGIHVMAAQSLYGSRLLQSMLRHATEYTQQGCTVALGVGWQDKVSFLFHWMPGFTVEEAIGRMSLRPATLSGAGLAILSAMSDEEITALYRERSIPGFEDDIGRLLCEMGRIRRQGYSLLREKGTRVNIGIPLGKPVYAGLAVAGAFSDEEIPGYVRRLLDTAAAIVREQEEVR